MPSQKPAIAELVIALDKLNAIIFSESQFVRASGGEVI